MLYLCSYDVVLPLLVKLRHTLQSHVVALRGATSEDDFFLVCTNQIGHLLIEKVKGEKFLPSSQLQPQFLFPSRRSEKWSEGFHIHLSCKAAYGPELEGPEEW